MLYIYYKERCSDGTLEQCNLKSTKEAPPHDNKWASLFAATSEQPNNSSSSREGKWAAALEGWGKSEAAICFEEFMTLSKNVENGMRWDGNESTGGQASIIPHISSSFFFSFFLFLKLFPFHSKLKNGFLCLLWSSFCCAFIVQCLHLPFLQILWRNVCLFIRPSAINWTQRIVRNF